MEPRNIRAENTAIYIFVVESFTVISTLQYTAPFLKMNDSSSTTEKDEHQKKLLIILLILFLVILLLLLVLILISIFLIEKNDDSPFLGGLKFRSSMEEEEEDDETCLPPSCIATCYKSDPQQRIGPNFYFDEPFDVLKTRLKINLTILRDVQIGINLVSPINRNLWHVTIRIKENATENSWNANRTVIGNVTDLHVNELFTLYVTPIPSAENELYGFQFDIQSFNKTKVTLGEIASPLKPGEPNNGTEYHIAAYGPILLSAYCTEVSQKKLFQ